MNLVLTISVGHYEELNKLTHPFMKSYAAKIGADFLCINKLTISKSTPHWEKFQIYDLLNKYERIIYFDSDILLRDDCPNLFDIVPKDKLGAFNEAPFTARTKEMMISVCKAYHMTLPSWNGKYYNTGVMVVSRIHKYLFQKPEFEYNEFFWEQGYLNIAIVQQKIPMFDLDYRYNRMTCMDIVTGEMRFASYVIHYAGCPNFSQLNLVIKNDIEKLKRDKNLGYKYKRNIYVSVSGGLGDQICAEPSVRFMKEFLYPDDNIVVSTHFPELFSHIDVDVYKHGEFKTKPDTPYFILNSLPDPTTITWSVVSNLLCNTVDYCSIAMLKRTLPVFYKQVRLQVDTDSLYKIDSLIQHCKIEDLVVVHPGRHWQSKTLPKEYWQEVINRLSKSQTLCLVGRDDDTRGVQDVKCPPGAYDFRNLLDLKSLIALISKAKMLLSNDSAPIHIAGAFDNWIALIPTCKHPDHVLPYRRGGNVYHKAIALYKALPVDEFDSRPTTLSGVSAEFTINSWDHYLLPASDIVDKINYVIN